MKRSNYADRTRSNVVFLYMNHSALKTINPAIRPCGNASVSARTRKFEKTFSGFGKCLTVLFAWVAVPGIAGLIQDSVGSLEFQNT
jgi:hypothetical protein